MTDTQTASTPEQDQYCSETFGADMSQYAPNTCDDTSAASSSSQATSADGGGGMTGVTPDGAGYSAQGSAPNACTADATDDGGGGMTGATPDGAGYSAQGTAPNTCEPDGSTETPDASSPVANQPAASNSPQTPTAPQDGGAGTGAGSANAPLPSQSSPQPAPAPVQEQHPVPQQTAIARPAANDQDSPHLGADLQAGYPWSLQATLVIKDFNLKSWGDPKKLSLDLFHEPNLSFSLDPKSGLTEQQMVALLNLHWIPPWKREIEVPLNLFLSERLSSKGPLTGGAQVQVEQHITGWFSITLNVTGTIGGDSIWGGGGGVLFHFDPKPAKP